MTSRKRVDEFERGVQINLKWLEQMERMVDIGLRKEYIKRSWIRSERGVGLKGDRMKKLKNMSKKMKFDLKKNKR